MSRLLTGNSILWIRAKIELDVLGFRLQFTLIFSTKYLDKIFLNNNFQYSLKIFILKLFEYIDRYTYLPVSIGIWATYIFNLGK